MSDSEPDHIRIRNSHLLKFYRRNDIDYNKCSLPDDIIN